MLKLQARKQGNSAISISYTNAFFIDWSAFRVTRPLNIYLLKANEGFNLVFSNVVLSFELSLKRLR